MRAQLVALALVERAFQQRAEDRRFHLFPVGLGRFDQQAQLQFVQRERVGFFEQATVEALEVLHEDLGETAGIHRLPQALEGGLGVFGVAAQFVQEFCEAAMRDQVHVFGEHREEATHEEAGHGLAVVSLALEALAQFGQVGGDVARDLGGFERRVKAVGIGPDGSQEVAGFFLAQIIEGNAITVAVGKLVVSLPLFREIGIEFDHVPHIDDQKEGRPSVFPGHCAGIVVGLVAGLEHSVVETSGAPLAMARLFWGIGFAQKGKLILVPAARLMTTLLGLENETAAAIKVDPAPPLAPCVGKGDWAFEPVIVVLAFGVSNLDRIKAEQLNQLTRKTLEIRHLVAAGCFPAFDEAFDSVARQPPAPFLDLTRAH